jgi:hypothetical protein
MSNHDVRTEEPGKINQPLRLLIAEDNDADAELMINALERAGIVSDPARTSQHFDSGSGRRFRYCPNPGRYRNSGNRNRIAFVSNASDSARALIPRLWVAVPEIGTISVVLSNARDKAILIDETRDSHIGPEDVLRATRRRGSDCTLHYSC